MVFRLGLRERDVKTLEIVLRIAQDQREGDDALIERLDLAKELLSSPDARHDHDGKDDDHHGEGERDFGRDAQSQGFFRRSRWGGDGGDVDSQVTCMIDQHVDF